MVAYSKKKKSLISRDKKIKKEKPISQKCEKKFKKEKPISPSNVKKEKLLTLEEKHKNLYKGWNKISHYGQCGQSCPCCRWKIGQEIIGSCQICKNHIKNEF